MPARWPTLVVLVSVATVATCATHERAEEALWDPPPGPRIAYRMRLEQLGVRAMVRVDVVLRGGERSPLPEPLVLQAPHRWAGFDDLDADIHDATAYDARGQPLRLERRPGRWIVEPDGTREVHLTYRVRPRARAATAESRFHAVGAPQWFSAYGRDVFVVPTGDMGREGVDLELDSGIEGAVWVMTSGGVGRDLRLSRVRLDQLFDAAYAAGHPRLVLSDEGGVETVIALDPQSQAPIDTILQITRRLDGYWTALMGGAATRSTTGIVLHRVDDRTVATGSGRPGGFVLELGDEVEAGSRLAELVAHEGLHRYVGMWLGFEPEDADETLWFKEGVVSYLAAQATVRSGLAGPEHLLEAVSRALTGYRLNRGEGRTQGPPADMLAEGVRRMPYERGFLLALRLDVLLRREGGSLERLVADLVAEHGGSTIGGPELRSFLETRLGPSGGEIWEHGRGLTDLPVVEWLTDAGLTVEMTRQPAAYFGLEVARDGLGVWRVVAIDPLGPASRARLRVGEPLLEPPILPGAGVGSEHRSEPGTGAGSARLVVERRGRPTSVSLTAMPGERIGWAVRDSGEFAALMGW